MGLRLCVLGSSEVSSSLAPNTCTTFVTVSAARSIAPTFMSVNMAVIEIWLIKVVTPSQKWCTYWERDCRVVKVMEIWVKAAAIGKLGRMVWGIKRKAKRDRARATPMSFTSTSPPATTEPTREVLGLGSESSSRCAAPKNGPLRVGMEEPAVR